VSAAVDASGSVAAKFPRGDNRIRWAHLSCGALRRLATAALFAAVALSASAQEAQSLAQQAKNPFADLVNLQFFYDANLGVAPANNTQQALTVEPLVPLHLNSDWIIVTRTSLQLTQPVDPARTPSLP